MARGRLMYRDRLTDPRFTNLKPGEENVHDRLLLVADDNGVIPADTHTLVNLVYPTKARGKGPLVKQAIVMVGKKKHSVTARVSLWLLGGIILLQDMLVSF